MVSGGLEDAQSFDDEDVCLACCSERERTSTGTSPRVKFLHHQLHTNNMHHKGTMLRRTPLPPIRTQRT